MTFPSAAPRLNGEQSAYRKKPNWLLRGMVLCSIGLHLVLFFYLADFYRSKDMAVIELSLSNENKAPQRDIPRPRSRRSPQAPDLVKSIITRRAPPAVRPIQMSPVQKDLPDGISESINDTLGALLPPSGIEPWDPAIVSGFSSETFDSPNSYLEMVRFRIEKNKLYPEKAKQENMRGRVIISMVINLKGEVGALTIRKSSGYATLDDAALSAVRRAMPFPAPPAKFFNKDILINIPILFEIT